MFNYDEIYTMACNQQGGESVVASSIVLPKNYSYLVSLDDSDYLAAFSKKIFQSGFVWRIVDKKWNNFEKLFWNFNITKLLMMPDDMLERKASDPSIIRNYRKVRAIRDNAQMIDQTSRDNNCSFAEFISAWPKENIVGLWLYLKKHGSRLGGNTGPYALRALGVDTFLLTNDVEGFLRFYGIVSNGISSKAALYAAQDYFNKLQQQSGKSLCELSILVSLCFGEHRKYKID